MKTQRRTADEQYQLIMECRSSGLSDYQWCTEHNINPGTFYNSTETKNMSHLSFNCPASNYSSYLLQLSSELFSTHSSPRIF